MEVIKYELCEINGNCKTKCPYEQTHLGSIIRVGSEGCSGKCPYYHSGSNEDSIKEIVCKYKDNVRKELIDRKIIVSDLMMDIKTASHDLIGMKSNIEDLITRLDKMEQFVIVLRDGE